MKNQLGWRITKQKLLYFKEQFTIRPDMFHKPLSVHFNEICTLMALCVQSLIVSVREITIMDFTWVITYAIYLIILRLITLFCQQDAPHENVKGLNQLVVIMWVTCELFFHIICSYGLVLITVLFVRFAFLLSFKRSILVLCFVSCSQMSSSKGPSSTCSYFSSTTSKRQNQWSSTLTSQTPY